MMEWSYENAELWQRDPSNWLELMFGVDAFVLQTDVQYEIGPEYEMWLERLETE